MDVGFGLAVLLPFVALGAQLLLWPWLSPFVWFLFFPTVFFSARLGGLRGGLLSTLISSAIVWYFFIPPRFSWAMENPFNAYSVIVFLVMGYLFSETHERLHRAQRRANDALAEAHVANEKVTRLYQKTLELDELKSQFFANVSHELRTPLTLIMSPLSRRLAKGDLPDAQRREDEMMLRNARLLYRHVSDLLDIAKLESGNMRLDYARLDVAWLVRTLASQFDSLAKEQAIDLRVEASTSVIVDADAEKLQRIVLNLLSNALKFTPEGGRIEVRVGGDDNGAVIEVQDNGPGVPLEQREVVFERFRQIDGSAQRRFGGTGLGLAIVKEFAELHGGRVGLEEAAGGGALFSVSLPRQAPSGVSVRELSTPIDAVIGPEELDLASPVSHGAALERPPASDASLPLILVVEDNPDMNAFIVEALSARYRVSSVADGRQGLASALACTPDLIISDVMMPNLSGDLMVAELRQHQALASVPVIMLTAKADDDLRVRLYKLGIQGYLNKPFSIDELLARVASLVGRRRLEQETLRQRERRFNDIVSASADWVWETDAEGRYTYVSDSVLALLGYQPAELFGKKLNELMGEDESARQTQALLPVLERHGAFHDIDLVLRGKDGLLHDIQTTGVPVLDADGEFMGYRGLGRDVSEKKQAEAKLRASEERLQLALDASQDGLWDWDLQNDNAYLTPRYYEMTGYDPAEVTPNQAFFQLTVHPDDWPRVMSTMANHFQGRTQSSEICYRMVRRDGGIKWILGKGQVVARDADGMPLRMIGTITDITEQRAAEEALRRQTEELSQRNAELERFNRATVGRELDMIELKRQINVLSVQLGQPAPYPSVQALEAVPQGAKP